MGARRLVHDMLTVYSSYGSPGASTTAVYLAAQWASMGRQVLLIEADGAAGTLSHKLGVQFTPGTASFIASGKPATAANLIDHAQDVLFNDLHVMPTPSSPSGARSIAERLARLGEELRDVADSELAVIVDAGRLNPDARTSELTTSASAVLIVTRDNAQLPSLEHLNGALVQEPAMPGPLGLVATVGPPALKEAEWRSQHGLNFVGSVELSAERGADLSMFMSRGKRKSRKLRNSVEKLAETLYEFACPASASEPRTRSPSTRREIEEVSPTQEDPATSEAPVPVQDYAATSHSSYPGPEAQFAQLPHAEHSGSPQPRGDTGHLEVGMPGPQPDHSVQPAQPTHVHQPNPQPPWPDPYTDYSQLAPDYRPEQTQQHPPHPYPRDEAIGHGPPGQHEVGLGPEASRPPARYPAHEMPPLTPEPLSPEHSRLAGYGALPVPESEYDAPPVPTGSFRSWAEQLHGESAGADSGEQPSSPGEGATA